MKTKIKTVHEEEYSDKSKSIGVLFNESVDENSTWKESFPYIYNKGRYVFFNTLIDLFDYMLYAEKKMDRAYLGEDTFDSYYDVNYFEGKFKDILKWTK